MSYTPRESIYKEWFKSYLMKHCCCTLWALQATLQLVISLQVFACESWFKKPVTDWGVARVTTCLYCTLCEQYLTQCWAADWHYWHEFPSLITHLKTLTAYIRSNQPHSKICFAAIYYFLDCLIFVECGASVLKILSCLSGCLCYG